MDASQLPLAALAILALVVLAFLAVFRGKGEFSLKTIFGTVKAEGENPSPPKAVPGGVKITGAEAKQGVTALSTGEGGVVLEKVKTGGKIDARHTPGAAPPKP